MKLALILLAVAIVLPCCVQSTTTHPDGSVTVTKRLDSDALVAGGNVVRTVTPVFYKPRQSAPVTSAKDAAVIELEPAKEPSWMELGLSLLGL